MVGGWWWVVDYGGCDECWSQIVGKLVIGNGFEFLQKKDRFMRINFKFFRIRSQALGQYMTHVMTVDVSS